VKDIIDSERSLYRHFEELKKMFDKDKYLRVDVKTGKQRTNTQNASLNLWCGWVAEALREKGLTFKQFFKEGFEVSWTKDIVKDEIWRPVQMAVCNQQSTTKPLTTEYPIIYDSINLKLSEHGMHVPWPDKNQKIDLQASIKAANKE